MAAQAASQGRTCEVGPGRFCPVRIYPWGYSRNKHPPLTKSWSGTVGYGPTASSRHIKEGPFFNYTTKRGYKIINTRQGKTPRFSIEMSNWGYNAYQCKQFYKELWHAWIPRKISTMVWLTCQGGLLLAKWRMRLGPRHIGICNLY
jgi:hypothetical protein